MLKLFTCVFIGVLLCGAFTGLWQLYANFYWERKHSPITKKHKKLFKGLLK